MLSARLATWKKNIVITIYVISVVVFFVSIGAAIAVIIIITTHQQRSRGGSVTIFQAMPTPPTTKKRCRI